MCIIESNVLHRSISDGESLSCNFFSMHCVNTSEFKREFQSNFFDDVRNKFVSAHCIVVATASIF